MGCELVYLCNVDDCFVDIIEDVVAHHTDFDLSGIDLAASQMGFECDECLSFLVIISMWSSRFSCAILAALLLIAFTTLSFDFLYALLMFCSINLLEEIVLMV